MKAPRLWMRWVTANAAGELFGLGLIAAVGVGLVALTGEPAGRLAVAGFAVLMIGLGAYEGFVVGWLQWRVLRTALPGLPRRSWVGATVVGAVAAWTLGMLPGTLLAMRAPADAAPPPAIAPAAELLLAMALGAVAGAILAYPQTRVLRRHVARSWLWLPANAVAWALGMVVIFRSMATLPDAAGPGPILAWILLSITASGSLVGAVHGLALVDLLRRPVPPLPPARSALEPSARRG